MNVDHETPDETGKSPTIVMRESEPAKSAGTEVEAQLQAWQERCATVEAALAAANDVLQRELPGWQHRCASTEEALTELTRRLDEEIPQWRDRCASSEEALAEANRRLSEEIPQWRQRCELAEGALAALEESRKGRSVSFVDTPAFLAFASQFTPAKAIGVAKVRVGAASDGGYVMLDDVVNPSVALSLGVGDNTSWDHRMADFGVLVHQYDHTVPPPPNQPSRIVFHPKQIVDAPDGLGATLEEALLAVTSGDPDIRAILKIDIEGSEWPVLDATPDAVLQRFDQIVCEYHDFGRAVDSDWFRRAARVIRKLGLHFQVIHIHANNNGAMAVVGGVSFPSILEVTYANRSRYTFQPETMIFPTALDRPNNPAYFDFWLGSFSFEKLT